MADLKEKQLNSKTIYEGKVVTITCDEAELSNGLKRKREVVHHAGGVVMLAEKDGKILMVRQFRYPIGQTLLELPAGKLDKDNENILDAAKRELLEETGYIANDWTSLGFIYTTPGFCNEKLYLFHAKDLIFQKQNLDEGEILEVYEIEKTKVFEMIKNNEIIDAKSICAVMRGCKYD